MNNFRETHGRIRLQPDWMRRVGLSSTAIGLAVSGMNQFAEQMFRWGDALNLHAPKLMEATLRPDIGDYVAGLSLIATGIALLIADSERNRNDR